MTDNQNSSVNSGVQVNVGMEFQKHCALYLFLEKYEEIKSDRYFIVFGYLSESDKLKSVETFQAKKSTNKWTINDLIEVIKKITTISQSILDDPHLKTEDFYQKNYFTTNNTIELKTKRQGVTYLEVINEVNAKVSYNQLDKNLKNKIFKGNTNISFEDEDKKRLENFYFQYIDLSRTPKLQIECLHGKFISVFGEKIIDHKAALNTFLFHLNKIESVFNQNNVALLADKTKQLDSDEINKILEILTTRKLAYDFWRQKGEEICERLCVSIFDSNSFNLHFLNSFDKFKDMNESEHRKVLAFVRENTNVLKKYSTDKECVFELYNDFKLNKTSILRDIQLKSAISAAYLEIKSTL